VEDKTVPAELEHVHSGDAELVGLRMFR